MFTCLISQLMLSKSGTLCEFQQEIRGGRRDDEEYRSAEKFRSQSEISFGVQR